MPMKSPAQKAIFNEYLAVDKINVAKLTNRDWGFPFKNKSIASDKLGK